MEPWLFHCLPGIVCRVFVVVVELWCVIFYLVLRTSSNLYLLLAESTDYLLNCKRKLLWINIIVFINGKSVIYKFSLFIALWPLDLFYLLISLLIFSKETWGLWLRVLGLSHLEDWAKIHALCLYEVIGIQGWKEFPRASLAPPVTKAGTKSTQL